MSHLITKFLLTSLLAISTLEISLPLIMAAPNPTVAIAAQSEQDPAEAVIRAVARPNLPKPTVEKLTIQGSYGLASWLMGEAGGLVALVNKNGTWQVIRLGGGLPNAAELSRASGIPVATAQQLLNQHLAAPFASILPQLKRQTQVPIFLPSTLPIRQTMYYSIDAASANRYTISINFTPDCRGTPCSLGEVGAERGGQFMSTTGIPRLTVKSITLRNNIPGHFINGCGAYCTATIEWQVQGVLYRVALKNGQEADVVNMANSAIAAGRR